MAKDSRSRNVRAVCKLVPTKVIRLKGVVYTKMAGLWYKPHGELQKHVGPEVSISLDALWASEHRGDNGE